MVVLISTNSSLPACAGQALRSLHLESPVRDDLFVEINHKWKNEPHRGDLSVNIIIINVLALTYYIYLNTNENKV
jgi:hypothetical protein